MNAYELNKSIGAILGALVFVMGLSVLSGIIFSEEVPETPAYQIAIAEPAGAEEVAEPEDSFAVLLASADLAAGEGAARVCVACHAFEEGGANKIGPGLYNVVGHTIAAHEGFTYSAALNAKREEVGEWTYEALDGFLENPQAWAPGTTMGYAGIRDPQQRANVVAYLRSISPDAPPLPEPEAAPADVAAADGTAAVGDEGIAAAAGDPFTQLVASADPAVGLSKAAVCLACHSIEEGAANRIGPNIHGVFGRAIASYDYDFSPAMIAFAEAEGEWNIENLSAYLEAPMEVVPGTKMAYAGIRNEQDRAEVIAWLHSISPEAGPIVVAAAPAAADGAAPAAETAAVPGEDAAAATGGATAEGAAPAAESADVVIPEAQGAIPVGAGVEGATAAGGEGSAPASDASSAAPAAAAAATAGEGTPELQGQTTAPEATEDASGGSLAPPAVNTQLPEGTGDGAAAAPAAAGTGATPAAGTAAVPDESGAAATGGATAEGAAATAEGAASAAESADVVIPETQGAIPVGAGVEGATAAGGEGSAPASDASSAAPAAAAAATAGDGTPALQGQTTAPEATEGASGGSLAPPAVNTQLPDGAGDGAAAAPAAAGTGGGDTYALPAETSLEGAGGREDPTMEDGAAAGVAEAASRMLAEEETQATGDPTAPAQGMEVAPEGAEPAADAPATPLPQSGAAPAANGSVESEVATATASAPVHQASASEPAGEQAAVADGTADSPASASAEVVSPASDGSQAATLVGGDAAIDGGVEPAVDAAAARAGATIDAAAVTAPAPAADGPASVDASAATARTNVVIEPAANGQVEIINPARATN